MKADLHVHSTASDGTLTPAQIVDRAHANGVGVLALSDHDSVSGVLEARARAAQLGVTLVEAVELSAVDGGRDIHLLGYFVDPEGEELAGLLERLRATRQVRAEAIVEALDDAGYEVSAEAVLRIAAGGAVGRSHIARALVEAGYADTVAQAFSTFIGRGRPFYVAKHIASPAEVIAHIRAFGAIPVLAHPGVTRVDDLIGGMVDAGLLGIEAYHADHSAEETGAYARLARDLGLLVTGGSDFHGPDAPNPDIGSVPMPAEAVEALLEAGGRTPAR